MSSVDGGSADLLEQLAFDSHRLRSEAALLESALGATLDLNPTDFACLTALFVEGDVSPGRLAEATGLTSGGVSGVLDRLERGGLIRREPDPSDRRRVIVGIADEQRAVLDELFAASRASIDDALHRQYSEQEQRFLLGHLHAQTAAISAETMRLREQMEGARNGTEERVFSAPLDARAAATLQLVGGGYGLRIDAEAEMPELFVARFVGGDVRVETVGDEVTVRGRRRSSRSGRALPRLLRGGRGRRRSRRGPSGASVVLNASVRWGIHLRGGKTQIDADLSAVPLSRIDITGGSGPAEFELARPTSVVPIHVEGGARELVLRRPTGVAARVALRGRVSRLQIDGDDHGAVTRRGRYWETADFDEADAGYDILINGGAVTFDLSEV
jgi:DNA-binding MarR family transcriptional regulator